MSYYAGRNAPLPAIIITPTGMVYDANTKQKIGQTRRWEKVPRVDSHTDELRLTIDLYDFPINTELPKEEKELTDILDQSRSIEVVDEK